MSAKNTSRGRYVLGSVKWAGLVVTLLVAGLMVAGWFGGSLSWRDWSGRDSRWCLVVDRGDFCVAHFSGADGISAPPYPAPWPRFYYSAGGNAWWVWRLQPWGTGIPTWAVCAMTGAPTGMLWWADRKGRRRTGMCGKCGYDRAGLASEAICPECGMPGI